ncbi:MAG: DVU_1553 family AMP-dependent CoA ligase [Pleomorphochaeta sp.]
MEITHLQDGLMRLCLDRMKNDELWLSKHSLPTKMDYDIFCEYKLHQLQQTVNLAYSHSSFYKKKFDEYGVLPSILKTFSDIEKFPFTYPEDINGKSYDFLCVSQSQVTKPVTFFSGGTTGMKKRIYFSGNDVSNIMKYLAIGMNCVASTDEVCQVIMPNSQGRGIGSILAGSLMKNGMKAFATDIFADSEEQIKNTIENKVTVWFGDAGTMYRITKECENKYDLKNLGMKIIFPTIGNISNTMKAYFERVWNCKVITHYGLTEMGWGLAVDCLSDTSGYHYDELDTFTECIDPKSDLKVKEGTTGELVFTSLGREAMPLIRYRSRDLASLKHGGCKCGKDCEIMGHIIKRIGGYKSPNGIEIYPQLLEDVLFSCNDLVDYRLYSDNKNLKIEVESLSNSLDDLDQLKNNLNSISVIKNCGLSLKLVLKEHNSLKQYALEKKRVIII